MARGEGPGALKDEGWQLRTTTYESGVTRILRERGAKNEAYLQTFTP